MQNFIRLVGPTQALEVFGVRLVGLNAENLKKFVFTIVYITIIVFISRLVMRVTGRLLRDRDRTAFWAAQANQVNTAVLLLSYHRQLDRDDRTLSRPRPCDS